MSPASAENQDQDHDGPVGDADADADPVADMDAEADADAEPREGSAVVVAVSGGCDSMVLLHQLAARVQEGTRWRLVVAHYNHGWRGAESDADERWVVEAAERLGLPVVVGRDLPGGTVGPGESPESAARRLRHAFLAATAREHGCDTVATAHHADDQTELFLMRLLRGAGAAGLSGMSASGVSPMDPGLRLVRPMIHLTRLEIEQRARDLGVVWREDASNRDPTFLRNRVRHELIPFLRARFQPALGRVLGREQEILREQARVVEDLARAWLAAGGAAAFGTLPVAVQRDVIRLQLEQVRVGPGFERIEQLRRMPGVALQVGPGLWLARNREGRVHPVEREDDAGEFQSGESGVDLSGQEGRVSFGGGELCWRRISHAGAGSGFQGEVFDAAAVGSWVLLRHWRPGDRFQPIGLGGSAKLQDLFTNGRVPAEERRLRVVAEGEGGGIFWVEGLRIGDAVKVTSATVEVLEWRWERGGNNALAATVTLPNLPAHFGTD